MPQSKGRKAKLGHYQDLSSFDLADWHGQSDFRRIARMYHRKAPSCRTTFHLFSIFNP
jgi:hypothetical protein